MRMLDRTWFRSFCEAPSSQWGHAAPPSPVEAFAQHRPLTLANLRAAHCMLLDAADSGEFRERQVVTHNPVMVTYTPPRPELVPHLMALLFGEVNDVLVKDTDHLLAHYHAALLHLYLVQVHPFNDGNGRIARLAHRWLLAQQLGPYIWRRALPAHGDTYYEALRCMGSAWTSLNWTLAPGFLGLYHTRF